MTLAKERIYDVKLRKPHARQEAFLRSPAKRKIIRAGRRSGKTTGIAIGASEAFTKYKRVLYAAPTQEQIERFWAEIKYAFYEPVEGGVLVKNETMHTLTLPGTETRIRAKTAWNADTLRGDYADLLILDEWQLMDEDVWETVGVPMLLDNDGDAVFIYTPPSLHSRSVSKARDPRHAAKMYQMAQNEPTGRWAAFHFTSSDNPHISQQALGELVSDMTSLAYRQEILAEDADEAPGALWTRKLIEDNRTRNIPDMTRVVIGIDPPGGITECGIIAAGIGTDGHGYVLEDASLQTSPDQWAEAALVSYQRQRADRIVGESNFGGDMVQSNIRAAARARGVKVAYRDVRASRGKAVRAEPVAALYEQGLVHHVGNFPGLEDEMTMWTPGDTSHSPNRMDALVWTLTELMLAYKPWGVA